MLTAVPLGLAVALVSSSNFVPLPAPTCLRQRQQSINIRRTTGHLTLTHGPYRRVVFVVVPVPLRRCSRKFHSICANRHPKQLPRWVWQWLVYDPIRNMPKDGVKAEREGERKRTNIAPTRHSNKFCGTAPEPFCKVSQYCDSLHTSRQTNARVSVLLNTVVFVHAEACCSLVDPVRYTYASMAVNCKCVRMVCLKISSGRALTRSPSICERPGVVILSRSSLVSMCAV